MPFFRLYLFVLFFLKMQSGWSQVVSPSFPLKTTRALACIQSGYSYAGFVLQPSVTLQQKSFCYTLGVALELGNQLIGYNRPIGLVGKVVYLMDGTKQIQMGIVAQYQGTVNRQDFFNAYSSQTHYISHEYNVGYMLQTKSYKGISLVQQITMGMYWLSYKSRYTQERNNLTGLNPQVSLGIQFHFYAKK